VADGTLARREVGSPVLRRGGAFDQYALFAGDESRPYPSPRQSSSKTQRRSPCAYECDASSPWQSARSLTDCGARVSIGDDPCRVVLWGELSGIRVNSTPLDRSTDGRE
jgi:hypothetical protein